MNLHQRIGHATYDGGRKQRRAGAKASSSRRHIVSYTDGGYVHTYHATKGWRVNKA